MSYRFLGLSLPGNALVSSILGASFLDLLPDGFRGENFLEVNPAARARLALVFGPPPIRTAERPIHKESMKTHRIWYTRLPLTHFRKTLDLCPFVRPSVNSIFMFRPEETSAHF